MKKNKEQNLKSFLKQIFLHVSKNDFLQHFLEKYFENICDFGDYSKKFCFKMAAVECGIGTNARIPRFAGKYQSLIFLNVFLMKFFLGRFNGSSEIVE